MPLAVDEFPAARAATETAGQVPAHRERARPHRGQQARPLRGRAEPRGVVARGVLMASSEVRAQPHRWQSRGHTGGGRGEG